MFLIFAVIAFFLLNLLKVNIDLRRIIVYESNGFNQQERNEYRSISHDDLMNVFTIFFKSAERINESTDIEGPNFHVVYKYSSGRTKTYYLWISAEEKYGYCSKRLSGFKRYRIKESDTGMLKHLLGIKIE